MTKQRAARRRMTLIVFVAAAGILATSCSSTSTHDSASGTARPPVVKRAAEGDRPGESEHRSGGKTLAREVKHDTGPRLDHLKPAKKVRSFQQDESLKSEPLPRPKAPTRTDPVIQSAKVLGPTRAAPTVGTNLLGVGAGFSGPAGSFSVDSMPPDTNAAVGMNHIVEIVNSSIAIWDRTGTPVVGPVGTNTLFSGFGGACQNTNDGDGIVRYDSLADRWVISQFAIPGNTGPYYECIAVSTTGDPTGTYRRYSFQYADFPDYPKLGVWPDAYYVTYNMFGANSYLGAQVCAMDRTAMLAGLTATQKCYSTGPSYGALLPADVDGATPPPAGEAETLVAIGNFGTTLDTWKFHADFSARNAPTFTGPISVAVAGFNPACNGGTCIPQPSTSTVLDSLADRAMNRLAYRNFGDHEAMVFTHSVTAGTSTGIRWYELRLATPASTPSVYQQGTYAPDSSYRWMGSAAQDGLGNLGIAYSQSSGSIRPRIMATGRLAGDALGTLTQGEAMLQGGVGSQTTGTRWGDYASVTPDPLDDCTLWAATEYLPSSGSFNWATRVTAFKLPGCSAPASNFDLTMGTGGASAVSVTAGSKATFSASAASIAGGSQSLTLSASGLPTGVTATLPSSLNTGAAAATFTLSTAPWTIPGTYAIGITATNGSVSRTRTALLKVTEHPFGGVVNGGFESNTLVGWTVSGAAATLAPGVTVYAARVGALTPTSGNSLIRQNVKIPLNKNRLSFYYQQTCPGGGAVDWAAVSLTDTATQAITYPLPVTCATTSTWKRVTVAVTPGHTYNLVMLSHDNNAAGGAASALFDDVRLLSSTSGAVKNGTFEGGTTTSWTTAGTVSVAATGHAGKSAQLGATTPTTGDSTLTQTFTAPSGATIVSAWWYGSCGDTVASDWATASLHDNTANLSVTLLPKSCSKVPAWRHVTATITASHAYTLTLTNHDNGGSSAATYSRFDDVEVL